METITQKFIIVVGSLALVYLGVRNFAGTTISTLLLYLVIILATRYPKVAVTDPFILTDCTELFVFLTAANLGYGYAFLLMLAAIWIPIGIEVKVESPLDSFDRTVSILIALGFFAILMKVGVSLMVSIALGLFVSSFIWSVIAFFGFHITNPSYFVVAFAKPIVFYRLLTLIGFD